MPQGNWTCSVCGGSITELPFEPKSENNLKCKQCFASGKGGGQSSGGGQTSSNGDGGEKKMYEGDWKCADCGAAITKLPFEPKNTDNLRCLDCFKKQRAQ